MDFSLQKMAPGDPDWAKVRTLYRTAFPREERAPYPLLKRRAAQGLGTMLAARDGQEFVGFAYLIGSGDLVYLFLLAIQSDCRGHGYGTKVLQALQAQYRGKRLFLAREQLDPGAPNYAQRQARQAFYLHNGLADFPCQMNEAGVVYDVMGIGGMPRPGEYEALMKPWFGFPLNKIIPAKLFWL